MGDSQHGLNAAQLAIYIILAIPVLYILIRHRLPGLLGWLYLFIFCTLRILGGALALHNGSADKTAAIISSIGLSPLLLAVSGILHEARHYRNPSLNKKIEFILILLFHIAVTTGLALLASGSSAFGANSSSANKSDENLLKVGVVILMFTWVILCAWTIFTFLPHQARKDAPAYPSGTKLLYAIGFSLPFVGMRVMYSLVSILAPSKSLSPVSAALGLKLALSFIPELIAVITFVVVGILTRNVWMEYARGDGVSAVRMESGSSWTGNKRGERLVQGAGHV
ncbi:uncharacterized protein LY89DRAFT_187767 [Mollisia scopiformis]|uniref:DUF7702 domain-containing protein n=1 Tax=Mollisia scopiformis TaxID=149040 RepID=A0A194XU96_MOLSC|nr:uncharacterized protein LY89DRAFT_187767 [Mollisia scopiformis]KUJ23609.1 hypothetical protein LY89DRAFT_187767 [Mollisia scopiformis]